MNAASLLQSTSELEVLSAQVAPEVDRWNGYVENSCTPDTYYRPQYVRAYSREPGELTLAAVVPTTNNRFLLPLVVRPVPISDGDDFDAITPYGYGGVLPLDDRGVHTSDAGELMSKLLRFCRDRNIVSLLVRLHPQLMQHEWLQPVLQEYVALVYHGKTTAIDCLQWDEFADVPVGLARDRRSNLNRARRELTVQRLEGGTRACEAGLETFRSIYELTMDRLSASDFYMFQKSYYSLLCNGLGRDMCLINALYKDQVVGSAIFFSQGEFAHYHLSGTTDEGRKFKAGTLILVEAARWARERGCHSLHLGGGTHADDSLFRFKQSFGGPTYQYHFLTAITQRTRYMALTELRNHSSALHPPRAKFFPRYRA